MKEYVRNRVLASMISPHAYFVPKAELLDGGILRVTGKKIALSPRSSSCSAWP